MKLLSICRSKLNTKLSFSLKDGNIIESVFYRGNTLCVSTQVGCGVGCIFCASGKEKLIRNLTFKEIVSQYEIANSILGPIKNIAMAGIGEPLHNWENVKKAFHHFKGTGLKVSFYTSGFPLNRLNELLELKHNGVTISLHAVDDFKRKRIMKFTGNIAELINFLKNKLSYISKRKRKKVSLGYILLKGINDSEEDISRLADISKYLGIGITLLYYNPVNEHIKPVSEEEYEKIFLLLKKRGIRVTLSNRFRKDPIGGCGTLRVAKIYSN